MSTVGTDVHAPPGDWSQARAPTRATPNRPRDAIGRDVGRPAQVEAAALARDLDLADRPAVDCGRQLGGEQGRGPGFDRVGAIRRLPIRVGRPERRGGGRSIAQGQVVGHGDAGEGRAHDQGRGDPQADPAGQAHPPAGPAAERPAGDAEAAEDARREERQQPRIGHLGRRQERLRAAVDHLVEDAAGRRDQEQDRADPEGHHPDERALAPDQRRPGDRGRTDRRRTDGDEADHDVDRDRPAGSPAGCTGRPGPTGP